MTSRKEDSIDVSAATGCNRGTHPTEPKRQLSTSSSWSSSSTTFAQRQLEKMGWSAGTGLGKKRNGVQTAIVVKKRVESAGLGSEEQAVKQKLDQVTTEWWKDHLGDTLEKLKKGSKKKSPSRKSKAARDSNDDDEQHISKRHRVVVTDADLFAATGGARFGMRAGKTRNQAKWSRTEGIDDDDVNLTTKMAEKQSDSSLIVAASAVKESSSKKSRTEEDKDSRKNPKRNASSNSVNSNTDDQQKEAKRIRKEEKKLNKEKKAAKKSSRDQSS